MRELSNKPKMVLFDYGGTLIIENRFDGIKGYNAILEYAKDTHGITAEDIMKLSDELNNEIHRFPANLERPMQTEVSQIAYNRYLFDYFNLEFTIPDIELNTIFWDNTSTPTSAPNIDVLLEFLHNNNIRSGVVSNMSYPNEILSARINRLIPNNHFEFIMSTADYIFRKPSKRIFDVALKKANLNPSDVIYCGDSYHYDVLGAIRSGITPIWYHKNVGGELSAMENSCITIEDWSQLIELISIFNYL